MAEFHESRPCVECDGTMDRRHGTLPIPRPTGASDFQRIATSRPVEVGTYYRCLKNGAHTVVVARDPIIAPRRPH